MGGLLADMNSCLASLWRTLPTSWFVLASHLLCKMIGVFIAGPVKFKFTSFYSEEAPGTHSNEISFFSFPRISWMIEIWWAQWKSESRTHLRNPWFFCFLVASLDEVMGRTKFSLHHWCHFYHLLASSPVFPLVEVWKSPVPWVTLPWGPSRQSLLRELSHARSIPEMKLQIL